MGPFARAVRLRPLFLLVCLLPGLLAGPVATLHADLEDDPACDPRVAPHDPANHVIGEAKDSSPGEREHCATCHWSRALGSPLMPEARPGLEAPHVSRYLVRPWVADENSSITGIPARSPPA